MPTLTGREKRLGLHLPVEVVGEDEASRGFTEHTRSLNISGGGIGFESTRRPQVGAHLDLKIYLPPLLRRHFAGRTVYRVRAVVCRVVAVPDSHVLHISARFLGEP